LAKRPSQQAAHTLTVAAYPAVDQIVRDALPHWQSLNPSVPVQIVSREFGDHHAALTAAMASRRGLPDIMAIEFGYLARFAASGALLELDQVPSLSRTAETELTAFALAQARPRGRLLALPTDIGPGAMFYRRDVIERSGIRESEMTESWSSFVATGERLRTRTDAYLIAHARDLKDAVIRTRVPSGEGLYFNAQGVPQIRSERFRLAFNLAREVRRAGMDARVPVWSNDWAEGLRRGRIATQLMGAWFGGHLANWLAPATAGLWRTSGLPGGAAASWGGTFYAISAESPNAQAALELVRLLVLERDRQLHAFRRHDAFPALMSAQDDPFFDEPLSFFGGQTARRLWRDIARRVPSLGLHRLDPLADEIVNAELDRVLLRGKDVDSALDDASTLLERRVRRMRS
jgi:multiple sugar transport system substrate-binding protein